MIGGRHLATAVMCAALCLSTASAAGAQTMGDGGRFELAGGVTWTGHLSLGAAPALETAPSGGFTLFSTSTEVASAPGVELRFGVRLTPVFEIEASSSYAQPALRAAVSGDAEGGAALTASETFHQYIVDAAIVANMRRWQIGSRATPFLLAGAGYIRDLHEGQTLAVGGQRLFGGGGVKYVLATRPHRVKTIGVRVDVRAVAQRKGVAFDGRARVTPAVGASLFVTF